MARENLTAHLRAILHGNDLEVVVQQIGLGRFTLKCVVLDQEHGGMLHGLIRKWIVSMPDKIPSFPNYL